MEKLLRFRTVDAAYMFRCLSLHRGIFLVLQGRIARALAPLAYMHTLRLHLGLPNVIGPELPVFFLGCDVQFLYRVF